MNSKLKKAGTACIILSGALWGLMGIFVRSLNAAGLDSMQIVLIRSAVTTVLMAAVLFFYSKKLLRIRLRDLWCFLGTGLVSILMFTYFYFRTMQLTSLSVAAILLYTAPVMVTLLSALLFREALTAPKLIACAMAFAGCVFVAGIFGNTDPVPAAAILTGLLSGFGYALYSIFSRYALQRGYHSLTITFYTFLIATLGVLPFLNWKGLADAFTASPRVLLLSIAMGIVTAALPYSLYTFGLTAVESSRASIMASVEPVIATLAGVLAFQEPLTLSGGIGILLVLAAIVILNLRVSRKIQTP